MLTVPTGVETRAIQDRTRKPRYSPAASLPTVSSLIVIDSPHAEAAHGQMTWIMKMNAAPANLDIGAPKVNSRWVLVEYFTSSTTKRQTTHGCSGKYWGT
ncbi:unnamed protein product [Fusarium graminearum]|nr:unnamed protein product [Fusarium graminearum]